MTYRGHIKDGVVVIDGDNKLEEGTIVRIEPVEAPIETPVAGNRLLKWAGRIDGLPSDSSVQLDHYLYNLPKK